MSEVTKDGKLSVKQGCVEVKASLGVDKDQDGTKSVEAEMTVKVNVAEVLKEVAVSKDSESLKAVAQFVKQYGALLPDVEKDILD